MFVEMSVQVCGQMGFLDLPQKVAVKQISKSLL